MVTITVQKIRNHHIQKISFCFLTEQAVFVKKNRDISVKVLMWLKFGTAVKQSCLFNRHNFHAN